MGMSQHYGTPEERDEGESIATIHRGLELGVTFFDTAEAYGPYTNADLVARALKGHRDRVVIATKFGFEFDATGGIVGLNSRPGHVREAVEGSLKRLQTTISTCCINIVSLRGAYRRRRRDGRARFTRAKYAFWVCQPVKAHFGAHAVHPIAALQSEYSVWGDLESRIMPAWLRGAGIGLVPFAPLGRGRETSSVPGNIPRATTGATIRASRRQLR
jgi:aryl-alcohol dehydrogenase-like predicted oxidoreductase